MQLNNSRRYSKIEKDCHNCSTRMPHCHSFCLIYLKKLANKKDKPDQVFQDYANKNITKQMRRKLQKGTFK